MKLWHRKATPLISIILSLTACGHSDEKQREPEARYSSWMVNLDGEIRSFNLHGCQTKEDKTYCILNDSPEPKTYPKLIVQLPYKPEIKEYSFSLSSEENTDGVSRCQPGNTGLLYILDDQSKSYFSCSENGSAVINVTRSEEESFEASVNANLVNQEGKNITVKFDSILFEVNKEGN